MARLPVFRTYGNALGFTLWNVFTIFRLTWLPIGFLVAVILLPAFFLHTDFARVAYGLEEPEKDSALATFLTYQLALIVLQAVAATSAAVAVHRVILFNDRKHGHYFLFAFGKTEVAFFVMGVLSLLIAVGVMGALLGPIIYLLAEGNLTAFFEQFENPAATTRELRPEFVPLLAAYFVGWIIVLVIFVRLAVWPPSVVATNRVSPAEAWSLTRGNFWRFIGLFALAVLTMYAIFIPVVAGSYLYFREEIFSREMYEATKDLAPRDALPIVAAPFLPALTLIYFFALMYVTALMVALVSFAYKALKGVDARASIDGG
jgi:hypothetical protein